MSVRNGQLLFSDAGQLQAVNGAAGVPAGAEMHGGWAVKTTGEPYVEDLNTSAVPAAAVFLGGMAHHIDGRLYVTTQAPAAADQGIGALLVRSDGALRISTSAVLAGDTVNGGWAVAQTGAARMAIT